MNQNLKNNLMGMEDDEINLGALLDTLYLDRKLIAMIAIPVVLLGLAYILFAQPVYETNITVQVEESPGSTKSLLGDAGSLFDVKTAASAEIEILRSRMVVEEAVDKLHLYIDAKPKYFPLIGSRLAKDSTQLSKPGIMGLGGYAWGSEAIEVTIFNVPKDMLEEKFILTADGNGGYELRQSGYDIDLKGRIGQTAVQDTPIGKVEIQVAKLEANAGTQFKLKRYSRLEVIEDLQKDLDISELGKQSGVIEVKLEGTDPQLTADTLNALGQEYIRQNVDRKAEEAEKTISFLDQNLPQIKRNLDEAETRYNRLRNASGTINLDEEAKGLLQQAVDIETKLMDAKRMREELLTRFSERYPSVVDLDTQLRILQSQKSAIEERIKRLPGIEQDVISGMRDVTVGTEIYTSLLNTEQQLRLAKASKIGTARMIDEAVVPEEPVKPKRVIIGLAALIFGLFMGVMVAVIRKAMHGTIDSPKMIEDATGLQVYASVLKSEQQDVLAKKIQAKEAGKFILAETFPDDFAIESLRSFRVALQFAMLDAANNRVMFSGPTPEVGKSFIAVNLAAILGQAGKRVLLLDMDLHKGHLNQFFGLGREDGLTELLVGEKQLEQVVKKNVSQNVDFMSNGTRMSNPSALFLNERLPQLFDQVSRQYDIVLVDAPPVLLVSDVAVIGANIGTTFLVVRDSISTIVDLQLSIKRMEQAHIEVKGVLFNGQLQRVSNINGSAYKYGDYKHVA